MAEEAVEVAATGQSPYISLSCCAELGSDWARAAGAGT